MICPPEGPIIQTLFPTLSITVSWWYHDDMMYYDGIMILLRWAQINYLKGAAAAAADPRKRAKIIFSAIFYNYPISPKI